MRYGAALLPSGRRRDALALAIEAILLEDFEDRVLPFDSTAARMVRPALQGVCFHDAGWSVADMYPARPETRSRPGGPC